MVVQSSFILMTVEPFFFASRRVIFEQEVTEETEKFSPLAQFAPVESSGSSVRVRKDKAMHTVGQFHLMEVDEQPNRDIQQLHIAQELGLVDGQNFLHGFCFHQHTIFHEQIKPQRLFACEAPCR
jgi:hypothetical protein